MIEFSAEERAQLEEIALLSNTPRYFVKHMQGLLQVHRIAELPNSRLVDEFERARALNDPTVCYAIIIATFSKPYSEMAALLEQFNLSGLRWGQQLRSVLLSTAVPMNTTEFRVEPRLIDVAPVTASASESRIVLP